LSMFAPFKCGFFAMITCGTANADNPGGLSALGPTSQVTATLMLPVSYLSHKVADTLVLSLLFCLDITIIDGSARRGNRSKFEGNRVSAKTSNRARRAD
jgi:hypothetical protein